MTELVGNFSLSIALLVSLVAALAAITGGKFASPKMIGAARWLMAICFATVTVSSIALIVALVSSDFRFEYVAHYTERELPIGYKLAAFWAGQEGSLLLWAWLLAAMTTIAVFADRSKPAIDRLKGDPGIRTNQSTPASGDHSSLQALNYWHGPEVLTTTQDAAFISTLAIVCGFFAALILFAANPFKLLEEAVTDGHGLNPMLQDPGMIAHPPLLFLGYAGFTIPFALLVGALFAGRRDNEWIAATRRWSLFSWLVLSIGILLGANWAYVELGWGGYWAWDPVENASLLPWLTGTALLHSIMVQQHRGMFKKWNAFLIAGTFILCIFGTYLTRSGVIDSVHAFPKSLIGQFFLTFLAIVIFFSLVLVIVRRATLKSEHELVNLSGKEGFFLATNVLLIGMTAIVLIGTIFPLISDALSGQKVTVGPNFYNKVVAPLGMILIGLMSVGPLLSYGKDAGKRVVRGLVFPVLIAIALVALLVANGLRNTWALIAAAIAACAIVNIAIDLIRGTIHQARLEQLNPISALGRLLVVNRRRYAAQITHVGMVMMIVGIVGSSVFTQKEILALKPGESTTFAGRTVTLVSLDMVQQPIFQALQATVAVADAKGTREFHPQIRHYNKWEENSSQVSIRSNLREDVYLTLGQANEDGSASIQAIVNPLVSWIWIGGITLSIGAILALLPRLAAIPNPKTIENQLKNYPKKGGQSPLLAGASR